MAVVERDTPELRDGGVKGALARVQRGRDDGQVEQVGREDVVEETPRRAPLVREQGVRAGRVRGQDGPGVVVVLSGACVLGREHGVVEEATDLGHGGQADDAFDREVGLVCEGAGKVVC